MSHVAFSVDATRFDQGVAGPRKDRHPADPFVGDVFH